MRAACRAGRGLVVLLMLAALATACGQDGDAATTGAGTPGDRLTVVLDDGDGGVVDREFACADAPEFCDLVRQILPAPPG